MPASLSGIHGMVNGVGGTKSWTIARTKAANAANNSFTRGGRRRKPGIGSWTGSYVAEGTEPIVLPGKSFTFLGYTAPNSSIESGVGTTYTGTAIANQLVIAFDKASNSIVSHTVNFVGHLILTETAADTAIIDSSAEAYLCSGDVVLMDVATPIADWVSATLTISSDVKSFVNSETANETGRRVTDDLDWTMAIVVERTDTPFAEDAQIDLQIDVGLTNDWGLQYGKVEAYSGVVVNRESQEIISQTLNIAMDSHKDSDGSIGQVIAPSLAVLWPAA